jgi:hypothetical protein
MSDEVINESQQETPEAPRMPLPPASFLFLVLSLRAQCEIQLGLMHYGEEEKPEPELELARHTIARLQNYGPGLGDERGHSHYRMSLRRVHFRRPAG